MKATSIAVFGIVVSFIFPGILFAQAPHVVSTIPSQNESNVSISIDISVTFDIDMDDTTINNSTFVVNSRSTGLHQGTITYDSSTKTAVMNPTVDFEEGEIVTVVLTTGIKSSGGNPLDTSYVWSFTISVSDGSGVFTADSTYTVSLLPTSVFAGDFDNDGILDIATCTEEYGTVSIYRGIGNGTFAYLSGYAVGVWPYEVVGADLDGDGDLDLATANVNYPSVNGTVSVLLNNGDGTFAPQTLYSTGQWARSVVASDLDGDGDLDLAASNGGTFKVAIFWNNGSGSFPSQSTYPVGTNPWTVRSADLNNDGRMDLMVSNIQSNDVSVLLNSGGGTFTPHTEYAVGPYPRSIYSADFDGDGDADIAAANTNSNNITILLNSGSGTFTTDSVYQAGTAPLSIFAADLNGDGIQDLITSNSVSNDISVLLGNGDAIFQNHSVFSIPNPYYAFAPILTVMASSIWLRRTTQVILLPY